MAGSTLDVTRGEWYCPPPSPPRKPPKPDIGVARTRPSTARTYAAGGAWGGGAAIIAGTASQDIPLAAAADAAGLLNGGTKILVETLKEPSVAVALARQGLRIKDLTAAVEQGPQGRATAERLLAQVLWESHVDLDGEYCPPASGTGPKKARPHSSDGVRRPPSSHGGFSDTLSLSSWGRDGSWPPQLLGRDRPEFWDELRMRTELARQNRLDRAAQKLQADQIAWRDRQRAIATARTSREKQLLDRSDRVARKLAGTVEYAKWQAARQYRIRQFRRQLDLERRGCAPSEPPMWA